MVRAIILMISTTTLLWLHITLTVLLEKNSWGTGYGDKGYIRIARGVHRPGGPFGITRLIIYPLKWSANQLCHVRSDADLGIVRM